jgi:hypothetical protein
MRIVIVGGGSRQWGPKLVTDILTTPSLRDAHIVLHDIDEAALEPMEQYARFVADKVGSKAKIDTTVDRAMALRDADFVVVTISTGGFASMAHDLEIPARYGIRQSVGDTVGPGGDLAGTSEHPRAGRHRARHGTALSGRVDVEHHEPDDVPHPCGRTGKLDSSRRSVPRGRDHELVRRDRVRCASG